MDINKYLNTQKNKAVSKTMSLLSKLFELNESETPVKSEKPYKSKSCPDADVGPTIFRECRSPDACPTKLHSSNKTYCGYNLTNPDKAISCVYAGPAHFRKCNKKPEQLCGREIQISEGLYICGPEFLDPLS